MDFYCLALYVNKARYWQIAFINFLPGKALRFEAVDFEFIVEKVWFGEVWFGLVWIDGLDLTLLSLILVLFGLVVSQTNKQIIINLICEFVFGYSTDKQTNKIII